MTIAGIVKSLVPTSRRDMTVPRKHMQMLAYVSVNIAAYQPPHISTCSVKLLLVPTSYIVHLCFL